MCDFLALSETRQLEPGAEARDVVRDHLEAPPPPSLLARSSSIVARSSTGVPSTVRAPPSTWHSLTSDTNVLNSTPSLY